MFRKGKTGIVAKLHRTDLVICSHSREGKTPSYSQINMVVDCCLYGLVCVFTECLGYVIKIGQRH